MKFTATIALLIGALMTRNLPPSDHEPRVASACAAGQIADHAKQVAASANVCYCGGKSYSEGHQACMGGFKMVCTEKGWANMKSGADNIPCSPDKCE
jgi:hypothetical protein